MEEYNTRGIRIFGVDWTDNDVDDTASNDETISPTC
jgi:pimeloyl-CoA synthetase